MNEQHNDTAKEQAWREWVTQNVPFDTTGILSKDIFLEGYDTGFDDGLRAESARRWTRVEGFRPADRQLLERARAILKHGTNGVVGEMEIAGAIEDLDELLHPNRFRPECIN